MMESLVLAAQAAVNAAQAMQGATPVVQTLTPLQQWGPFGAVVVALGGPKAIQYALAFIQSRSGKEDTKASDKFCPLHDEFSLRLQERHDVILKAIEKIEQGINRIHERIDDLMKDK